MKQKKLFNFFISFIAIVFMVSIMACSVYAAQSAVNLGTSGNFVILAKTGISTTGVTSIVGDIGVSPIDSTAITGFGLIMDSSGQFSTSSLVTGSIYAANYGVPTPTTMTTAIGDMQTAYTDAAGRVTPDFSDLGAGEIGGLTLAPGLYKWGTGVTISNDVTINGSSTDVWIFQVAGTLGISNGKQIILIGGAQASNIFWQVAGQTTLGTTSVFEGNILGQTAIVLNTGSTLNGRALAQTAVTADANSVSLPAGAPVLTTITLLPTAANLSIGNTQQMNATGFDQFSAPIVAIISFNSSNTTVALANASTGLVTAVASGNTTITARSGNISATSVITVMPAAVLTTIVLMPASANLSAGNTLQLNATGFDQYNQTIAAIMAYASDNLSVATVNSASGIVTAIAPGNATINASSGNISATSVITVETAAPILNPIGSRIVTQGTWLNFTITATSPSGLNLTFAISGQSATANFTDNLDGTAMFSWMSNLSDVGVTNVNFTVTDSIKSASEIVSITVNAFQAPTAIATNPGSTWTNADYNVTLNATGFNNTPVAYINYTLNNVAGQIIGSFGDVLINTSGNNTLMFYAVDALGNVETPNTIYVLLDKTVPNITSLTLSATSVNVGTTITGTCAVTDNLDTTITGIITGIDTSTAGTKTATCTATDLAGNIATVLVAYTVNAVSSGGGGGGGGGCLTNWICSEWSVCSNGEQTRTCQKEKNYCSARTVKPALTQSCTITAVAAIVPKTAPPAPTALQTADLGSTVLNTGTTGQDNVGITPAGGNQITGESVIKPSWLPSWWVAALLVSVLIGLVISGYFIFRSPEYGYY